MEQDRLWQAVLGDIEIGLSRGNYLTWFKNTQLLRHDADRVIVGVPNVFIKQQLEKKYNDLVTETLRKNGVEVPVVEYKIQSVVRRSEPEESITIPAQALAPKPTFQSSPRQDSSLTRGYRQGLNERYTFDTFVVGSGNELAYAACQAIVTTPGSKYNPLFLYGGVGIGKTHLIQAVGNGVLAHNPQARVVYVSSEQFLQEFVDALRYRKNTDFADHYRSADVLIVDDIQFIAGKEKVQEEFFHTFNALHQASKQIIISSDKPPKEIATLEERLRSRFAWGMSIDMQTPDFETRCAIIQIKAEGQNIGLPNDLVDYLATNVSTNIRELEGALNQLLAFCEMRQLEPNLAIATGLLGASQTRPKHLSARQIIERCAKHYQISFEDITGPKRDKDVVVPRQIAMYMLGANYTSVFLRLLENLGEKTIQPPFTPLRKSRKNNVLMPMSVMPSQK